LLEQQIMTQKTSTTHKPTATISRRHWLPLKRRIQRGEVSWLSGEGMIILSTGNFPIGAEVSVNIRTNDHKIKRLPAAIVRAEPAGSHTRYSLRFHKDRLASADKGLTVRLLNYLAHQFQS
jgi:hypothetical protein